MTTTTDPSNPWAPSMTYEEALVRLDQSYLYHSRIFPLVVEVDTDITYRYDYRYDTEELEEEDATTDLYYRYQLARRSICLRARFVWLFLVYLCTHLPYDVCKMLNKRAQEACTYAKDRSR